MHEYQIEAEKKLSFSKPSRRPVHGVYQKADGQKHERDGKRLLVMVLNISESRRSETKLFCNKIRGGVQCISESRRSETTKLTTSKMYWVQYISESRRAETSGYSSKSSAMVQYISESRRPETFTLRIDKASVVILDRSRKETPSASQAGDSPRCISESRRSET